MIACSSTCPASATASFTIDTTALPEGFLDLDSVAVDRSDNFAADSATFVVVDKTPPPAPDRVRLRDYDAAAGTVVLDWRENLDPDLPGDVPGSAVERTDFRISRDGGSSWSGWTSVATDTDAVVGGVSGGSALRVQLRSADAAENISATTDVALTVQPDPAPPSAAMDADARARAIAADVSLRARGSRRLHASPRGGRHQPRHGGQRTYAFHDSQGARVQHPL